MRRMRPGFTLIEMLIVICCLGALVCLLLPAMRTGREATRRMQCSNNLKGLVLGLINYESAYKQFPTALGGTTDGGPMHCNMGRRNFQVSLLGLLESSPAYTAIMNPLEEGGVQYPAEGPAPWITEYPPWQDNIPYFLCPSSQNELSGGPGKLARSNYGAVVGDIAEDLHTHEGIRGFFNPKVFVTPGGVSDGLSNTIAIAEYAGSIENTIFGQYAINQTAALLDSPEDCLALTRNGRYLDDVPLSKLGRGGAWADGGAGIAMVNTILPPNSASCAIGGNIAVDGIYSASSLHSGGVNVAMADGSVQFVSEDIDCGPQGARPLSFEQWSQGEQTSSPFGVWGAFGTAAGEGRSIPESSTAVDH